MTLENTKARQCDNKVALPGIAPSVRTEDTDPLARAKVQQTLRALHPRSHIIQMDNGLHFQQITPKDWPARKQWTSLMILSSFAFIHPLSETMIAPAMSVIARDLRFSNQYDSMLCLSAFLIGIAVGPLILAPLSEVYGRKPVLLSGGLLYTIWTTVCGFAKNKAQLFVFRTLSGFGGSVALAIGGGVIGDVWKADRRARALAWYLLAPLLGPAIGPIVGGF